MSFPGVPRGNQKSAGSREPALFVGGIWDPGESGTLAAVVLALGEGAVENALEFLGSAGDGVADFAGVMGDRLGLETFDSGFHHAALIIGATFVGVDIGKMDFDAGDVTFEAFQGAENNGFDDFFETLVSFDAAIGIDLYFHGIMALGWV